MATGCRARTWPGDALAGMHTLRSVDDALALRAAFALRPRVAIIGAGFIGCEVAATARKQDLDVTVIDIAPHPMLPLGPELGERCAAMHRRHGVDLRLQTGVASSAGGTLTLTDGSRVEADVVVVALGAVPNTEWLGVPGGLPCDATLTSLERRGILAAGDAIRGRIRWRTASRCGSSTGRTPPSTASSRAATRSWSRASAPLRAAVPYFWSDQYDVKIQAAGLPARAAERRADRARRRASASATSHVVSRRHLQRAAPADALPPPARRRGRRLDELAVPA